MRVGTGIILSVLSPSVLAAVIPNYDSHGLLLARRAVNPDPMNLLWKRNNGEQTGTGTGIGESNPNSSGDNIALSKMGRLREFAERLRMRFMKNRDPRKQQYILRNDEKSLQNAAKKLAEVTEGDKGAGENHEERLTKDPSKFANFKSGVQKRLGIKNKSSTGGVLSSEESDHQISGQDTSDEKSSDENTSNQEEPKQGPSDGDTSGQGPSNQAGARPIPAPRKSKLIGQETRV
ncbi:hypothetical protein BASA50_009191 [Batrachochytrium salamandrivorans]|uniref:Uncharacterized protein n=1 Tax=Batrachochytrium salamandrivorans TaxID=1357716 RepID=A0ABQ8F251_9FUNG|nr:hypothetical protein BASA50_009191 [Batrachochytrium salamandrivorans]